MNRQPTKLQRMLTPERLAVLTATANGEIRARLANAPGSPLHIEPREYTVAFGYLRKANLVEVETDYLNGGRTVTTVNVTDRGSHALAGV